MRMLAYNGAFLVITINSQKGSDLLYSLSISSNLFMKLTIDTFDMGINILIMKSDSYYAMVLCNAMISCILNCGNIRFQFI